MLQEATNNCDTDTNVSVTLPRGVLQDWLQSVDALKAAADATGRDTDIANHPRLLKYLQVRCFSSCVRQWLFARVQNCGWQHSLLVLLQGHRAVKPQDDVFSILHVFVEVTYISVPEHDSVDAAASESACCTDLSRASHSNTSCTPHHL